MKIIDRDRRIVYRRIEAAKFPTVKSLDRFDYPTTSVNFVFKASPPFSLSVAGIVPVTGRWPWR
jgi:hypothetical protein